MSLTDRPAGPAQGMDALVFHGWALQVLGALRACFLLAVFLAVTVPLMLVQLVLLLLNLPQAKTMPNVYHKLVCRILGIRVHVTGSLDPGQAALLISNHVSWLDIIVLSAAAPVSFVAKSEVKRWPFFNLLAFLQRSVFIERTRRTMAKQQAGDIAARLAQGDNIVLFAEGTSSDGNRVLPFRSSLFSAATGSGDKGGPDAVVRMVTIAYTHLHGLPLLRHQRPLVAYYGEMNIMSHVWNVLKSGPLDVTVSISEAVPLESLSGRKELAAFSEARIRRDFVEKLTARPRAATPEA